LTETILLTSPKRALSFTGVSSIALSPSFSRNAARFAADISLTNAAFWTLRLLGSDDATIDSIRIDADLKMPNNDGSTSTGPPTSHPRLPHRYR